jgi:predicted XRE-type DNA-binding protein
MIKVDTKIRHITKPGTNIFSDLGFDPDEAQAHEAQAQQRFDEITALKQQLMVAVSDWIDENHLKQDEAAVILKVTRPRVSDVVNQKVNKFTIDALVDMLARIGKPVRLAIG